MSRPYSPLSLSILNILASQGEQEFKKLYKAIPDSKIPYKEFYNNLFRLFDQGLLSKNKINGILLAKITEEGKIFLKRKFPEKDGVWKIVIFDIPEKHKKVRNILRAKLKELFFKKWQNSIWISPYALDKEIENELNELGKKFFVRVIKTTNINITNDLDNLFE